MTGSRAAQAIGDADFESDAAKDIAIETVVPDAAPRLPEALDLAADCPARLPPKRGAILRRSERAPAPARS